MAASLETFQFQAETKQLLDLVINSLYTDKEIFLRELISNASDAIDRLRFEALTNPDLLGADEAFEIRLAVDRTARTLTLSDNGIGMSRDEVIANIGTIAKSGTRELREQLAQGESPAALAELIGQFGVGFYSSFMVADTVTLVTRRAGTSPATRWESRGDGHFTLTEATRPGRGTAITLHLRPADPEQGLEDFTDTWTLARIVKKYSDFVSYPIILEEERQEPERDAEGKPKEHGKTTTVIEDKVLNSMKPIWTRPSTEVTDREYAEFYRHIAHDWTEPLKTIAVKAEGRSEYQALLFIPAKAPFDLYYHGAEAGLRLHSKRVMIMERCPDLLPRYLRFMKGIVDSADLPLNISRQMLQQDRHITQIRKWLTRKVLSVLEEMAAGESDKYLDFWKQFGRALKEGVGVDHDNKDRLVGLLLFESSHDEERLTTLKDYVGRMPADQTDIFYLTGESRRIVEHSPHLEALAQRGHEVLYLTDPVDELLVQSLPEYEGKKLKSAAKGRPKLGTEKDQELAEKEREAAPLLELLQKSLDAHVKQVRLTKRLTASPVCLVVDEHEYSPHLERLLQKGKGGGPRQRRVLELNPDHPIFLKMNERFRANADDPRLAELAELLFGYALLAEGSELPDPVSFTRRIAELMAHAV